MWQRLTIGTKQTLMRAERIAKRSHRDIGPVTVLRALMRHPSGADLLKRAGADLIRLKFALRNVHDRARGEPPQISATASRVLFLAFGEARALGDRFVGPCHVALALMRTDQVLGEIAYAGARYEQLHKLVLKMPAEARIESTDKAPQVARAKRKPKRPPRTDLPSIADPVRRVKGIVVRHTAKLTPESEAILDNVKEEAAAAGQLIGIREFAIVLLEDEKVLAILNSLNADVVRLSATAAIANLQRRVHRVIEPFEMSLSGRNFYDLAFYFAQLLADDFVAPAHFLLALAEYSSTRELMRDSGASYALLWELISSMAPEQRKGS